MKLVYLNISDKIYLRNIIAIKASYVGPGQLLGVPTMARIARRTATARSWAEGRKAGASVAAAPPFLCRPPLLLPQPPTMLLVGASTWRPRRKLFEEIFDGTVYGQTYPDLSAVGRAIQGVRWVLPDRGEHGRRQQRRRQVVRRHLRRGDEESCGSIHI